MFIIEFTLCLGLLNCITPIVDIPRSKHETYDACMQAAYYKALELYNMNNRPDTSVKYICLPEIIGKEV